MLFIPFQDQAFSLSSVKTFIKKNRKEKNSLKQSLTSLQAGLLGLQDLKSSKPHGGVIAESGSIFLERRCQPEPYSSYGVTPRHSCWGFMVRANVVLWTVINAKRQRKLNRVLQVFNCYRSITSH